jgi:hypothetical protein
MLVLCVLIIIFKIIQQIHSNIRFVEFDNIRKLNKFTYQEIETIIEYFNYDLLSNGFIPNEESDKVQRKYLTGKINYEEYMVELFIILTYDKE